MRAVVVLFAYLQEKRSVTVAVRTRPTAVFAQDQVILDLENNVRVD
jgi:hypothetical protein